MLFWIWVLLLGGGVFFSLRVVIPFIVIYRALSGMTFLCSKVEKQPKEAVPDDILSRFVDTSNSLRTLGFQLIDYYLVASIEGQPPEWAMHWQNSAATIHATVMPVTSDLSALMPLYVSFSSVLTDNRQLISINRKADGIFPPVPQKVEAHYDGMPIDELLKVHQHRLEPFLTAGLVQPATPAEYVSSCKAISLQTAVLLQRQGEAIWVRPNETYRFSRLRAIKSSYNFLRSNKRTNTSADSTSPSQQESNLKEGDITAQVAAFQQAQQKKSGLSLKTRRGLVLASLALFIAVYAASLNIRTVLIFVMVLLLHEGGHVFAMKLFGYRDVAMLFIPFLGALATAKKDDATLTEKVWISLAGPLPGLCLAVLLSAILQLGWISPAGTAAIWLAEAIPILLFLNLFNLLPMYPLDGGQVADLLLFSRRPYFGTVFKVVGVSVLSLLSIFIGQPLLLVFAGLIGATLPASFRIAKFNRQLQKDLDLHSDNLSDTELSNTPLHTIFRQLQHPGYAKLSAAQKMTVAKGALESYQSLRSPRKNWLGLLAIYIMSLLLSLFGSIFSMGALTLVESETMLSEEPPTEPIDAAAFAHQCVDVEALPEATALQKVPDDELMSDRQITLVGKFTTPEQAQSVWQSVFPKLNESDSAQVFGSLILVSTFSDRTQNTITSEFQ
ncbi:MAG: site-2 protease family protein, partial [Cyanobacteria bacterium P01_D01_bin.36]